MAKIIRILTYTANDDDLRTHMRNRGIKGERDIVPGIHVHESFIHANAFDFMDSVGTNPDDVILDTFIEYALKRG